MKECMMKDFGTPTNEFDIYKTICTRLRSQITGCLDVLMEQVAQCLHEEEKFLPDFVKGVIGSLLDQHCKDEGREFSEKIAEIRIAPCKAPMDTVGPSLFQTCVPKLRIFEMARKPNLENPVLTKDILCSDLDTLFSCISVNIEDMCQNPVFADFIQYSVEPYLDWCKHNTK